MKSFLAACGILLIPVSASAALGPYVHGYGIKSLGFGGIGIGLGEETTALVANPAHAFSLGNRYDIGLDLFAPVIRGSFVGNAAGPDEKVKSTSNALVFIPQGGYSRRLTDQLGLGLTVSSAGLGPDYKNRNPYRRFGGSPNASLTLTQVGLLTALAYEVAPAQSIGVSLNLVYQMLEVKGVQPFAAASRTPNRVSNQGTDGRAGTSLAIGWKGQLLPGLAAAATYNSKTFTERHQKYEGLIPNGGKLELPSRMGVGLVLSPQPQWTVALDAQRFYYHPQRATGNGIAQLAAGNPLGSKDGPGFGLRNQNVYKLGVAWEANPKLTLRAGYIYATQMVRPTDTLFSFLAPTTTRQHYTAGATYLLGNWEMSGYAALAEKEGVDGQNSIPPSLGGGEANLSNQFYAVGLSFGRRFGKTVGNGSQP